MFGGEFIDGCLVFVRDSDDDESFAVVLCVEVVEMWDGFNAGTAPRGPKFDDHGLAGCFGGRIAEVIEFEGTDRGSNIRFLGGRSGDE